MELRELAEVADERDERRVEVVLDDADENQLEEPGRDGTEPEDRQVGRPLMEEDAQLLQSRRVEKSLEHGPVGRVGGQAVCDRDRQRPEPRVRGSTIGRALDERAGQAEALDVRKAGKTEDGRASRGPRPSPARPAG